MTLRSPVFQAWMAALLLAAAPAMAQVPPQLDRLQRPMARMWCRTGSCARGIR